MSEGFIGGGFRPNHPTRIVESSSYARESESSLTLPVMPRSRRTPKGRGIVEEPRTPRWASPSSRHPRMNPKRLPPSGTLQAGRYPFAGRCDLIGWSLPRYRATVRPRTRPSSAARSPRIITTRRPWCNPWARHASWLAHSSRARATCQATPEWFLQFNFQGPTNEHSRGSRILHATRHDEGVPSKTAIAAR
jgi:hypothetical protein